jgi:hypothetical protein
VLRSEGIGSALSIARPKTSSTQTKARQRDVGPQGKLMEDFIHRQNIVIFRRLLSTQTDGDESRRQTLLGLLAKEEAKETLLSQRERSSKDMR